MKRMCGWNRALAIALLAGLWGMQEGCNRAGRKQGKVAAAAPRLTAGEIERYQSLGALAELRDRAESLLEQSTAHADPQVRGNAIEGLIEAPDRLNIVVHRALVDANPGVRSTAALAVGTLKLKEAASSVRPLLRDSSGFVKASAMYALTRCGEAVDLNPLSDLLLGDPSPRVRAHAAFLLGELGEPSAAGLLKEAAQQTMPKASAIEIRLMQLQIAEALVKIGEDAQLEAIRACLYPSRPEDLEVAALAVQIIGQVGDKGAMDQLIYLTAYNNKQEGRMPAEIRLGAAISLANLGNDRGGFIADEFVASPVPALRAQAAFVYGSVGRTENLPRLDRLLGDPDPATRVAAAAATLRALRLIAPRMPAGK